MSGGELTGQIIDFMIEKKHYLQSGKEFDDGRNCPFHKAIKDQFPQLEEVSVGWGAVNSISVHPAWGEMLREIGTIEKPFTRVRYWMLKWFGIPHKTRIVFNF